MVKVAFTFKLQGIQKIELYCQNLRYESLIVVDPKYIENSNLSVLNIKQ